MKYLVLIIYDSNVEYERHMYKLHTAYLKKKNIVHYFITYNPNQSEDMIVDDNVIKFNGKESFVPGILTKTMKALKYLTEVKNLQYEYLVRTNISTIINYDNLTKYIDLHISSEQGFFTFFKSTIAWVSPRDGISEKHRGISYAQGTNIFLNYNSVKKLLLNDCEIDYNMIDDVSIGHTLTKLGINLHDCGKKLYITNEIFLDKNAICFRNRRTNRYDDVCAIKLLYETVVI